MKVKRKRYTNNSFNLKKILQLNLCPRESTDLLVITHSLKISHSIRT